MTTATKAKPRAKRKQTTICSLSEARATIKEERVAEFRAPRDKVVAWDVMGPVVGDIIGPTPPQIPDGLGFVWQCIGATVLDLSRAGMRLVLCEITERGETEGEGEERVEYVVREVRLGFA